MEMNMREKIVEAGLKLFSTKGYEKTTISDLVKASGSSRGGFYHHFQSKEDVLIEIIDLYMKDLSSLFPDVNSHEADSTDQLLQVFYTVLDYKIQQVSHWDELYKIFAFKDNHQVIMQLAKQFEALMSRRVLEVVTAGSQKGQFNCMYKKPFSDMFTREVMVLTRRVQKAFGADQGIDPDLAAHIDYLEFVTSSALGIPKDRVTLRERFELYLQRMEGTK